MRQVSRQPCPSQYCVHFGFMRSFFSVFWNFFSTFLTMMYVEVVLMDRQMIGWHSLNVWNQILRLEEEFRGETRQCAWMDVEGETITKSWRGSPRNLECILMLISSQSSGKSMAAVKFHFRKLRMYRVIRAKKMAKGVGNAWGRYHRLSVFNVDQLPSQPFF